MRTFEEQKEEILADFKERVTNMVSEIFKEEEHFEPTVFFLAVRDGKLGMGIMADIGKLFVNDMGKTIAAEIIKKVNEQMKPIALAFASEGWAIVKPGNEKDLKKVLKGPRPSESPDRKEILFINFETFDKECNVGWQIVRDIIPGGELVPSKEMNTEWAKKSDRFAGKFANLLTDNYSELNKLANDAMNNTN